MKRLIKAILRELPYIKSLHRQIEKQGIYPAGHFCSPIPDKDEVLAYIDSRKPPKDELPGIDLHKEDQSVLLREYSQYYDELPFPEKQEPGCRFYYDNPWYSYSDAIFLYGFLRKHRPRRIIEVGSGFSSAVILDTTERLFSRRPEITFVEPYPDRLKGLFKGHDENQVKIIEKKIQEVPSELFSSLEAGDLLFIDSSHVVKCGSDLQLILFDIMPLLPAGIFMHFHDIFYPFEYPSEWLKKGRYLNEDYFLRAFLSYNSEWIVYFFNTYLAFAFGDFIKEKMPLCAKNPGGSLYITKVRNTDFAVHEGVNGKGVLD